MAVTDTACCRKLRDEWRKFRENVLQMATSAAVKNADLRNMLADLENQGEGKLLS
jgi:hypothetical protein